MRPILPFCLSFFLAGPALAANLEALLEDPAIAQSHVGIEVRTLDGQVLWERNAQKLFTPASVQKLFTAVGALHFLGADARFATELRGKGGNLYLKGFGDPSLGQKDLENFAKTVRSRGIRQVEDLVVDPAWETEPLPPGWMQDDLGEPYAAPTSGLSLDENSALVEVDPGAHPGDPVRVQPQYLDYLVEAKTGEGRLRHEAGRLVGALPPSSPPFREACAVSDPPRYAGQAFAACLRRNGVEIKGKVGVGPTPTDTERWATHWSPPLAELVRKMDKESDNFLAETLLAQIGVCLGGPRDIREAGLSAVRGLLEQVDPQAIYRAEDGSGLSRYDLVSPRLLNELLAFAARHAEGEVFRDSLPVAGKDGTLAHRGIRYTLRAKTGTMAGVSALSGYLELPDRKLLVSVLVNGFVGSPRSVQRWQDALINALGAASLKSAP